MQGQFAVFGRVGGGLQFRARFDAELLGEASLVGGQAQVRGEQRDLAFADHLDQVELGQRIRIVQRLQALRIQFDRDRVVVAVADRRDHGIDAGLGNMRGAEQGVTHAVAFDDLVGLAGERIGAD